MKRILGRSGIEVSALGLGCWAIGGPWKYQAAEAGWSAVDDSESIRAIHQALDMGVNLFDTAANYGCGHSERLLGKAIKGRRDSVVIATKFGFDVDEKEKVVTHYGASEGLTEENADILPHMDADLATSLRRLGTDYIDVYQFHVWGYDVDLSHAIRERLESYVSQGKIRTYGWSTDRIEAVQAFAIGSHCGVLQQQLNIFDGNLDLLGLCDELNLASLNRGPLGMGILTGKFSAATSFAQDDVRKHATWFPGFKNGQVNPEWLDKLSALRDVLTSGGRTLAQGALAWLWGVSSRTIPIPGFKTVAQVSENAGALAYGPLTPEQMVEIDVILDRALRE